jgi:hypothetical protein
LLQRRQIIPSADVSQSHADIAQKPAPLDSLDRGVSKQVPELRVI